MDMTRNIIRTEGIRGLFRGLTTTLIRECPGYGCFFGGYELTRSILTNENQKKGEIGMRKKFLISISIFYFQGFIKTWISGGMAGICFWIFMIPVDAIKSRIQVFKPNLSFAKYTFEIIKN